MTDANSDSDDGVYCELKEYIKQARMNLRKVKRKEPEVVKGDKDSDDNGMDDEIEKSEVPEELITEPVEEYEHLNAEDVDDKEDMEIVDDIGSDIEQESDEERGMDGKDGSVKEDNEKTELMEQDDEVENPNPYDAIESDKEDIATSDNDDKIVEVEQEIILSDEENNQELNDESDNIEMQVNDCDRDENNSDNEDLTHEYEHVDETVDNEEVTRSVNDIKNCFESRIESTSSTGVFRSLHPIGSDNEDQKNETDEETNNIEDEKKYTKKQNPDDEFKATDDDSASVDAFNIQYRYALRHSKRMRQSQQPSEEINDQDNARETEEDLNSPEIIADSVVYNNVDGRLSCYNEHIMIAQATIERLYDYVFHDPWEVLNQLLDSKRSSKSSTEVDGMMSSPQQIFYTNEVSIKEKINEIEIEENIENAAENEEKVDLRLNTRALSKEAKTYELERFHKNILIIFNQERIAGYKPRLGTRQDVEALTQTFSPYGFDVIEHLDLNRDEIFEELKQLTEINFTEYGCLAIAVLTHGSDMDGLRAKDRLYYQNDIIKYLKTSENPTLVTKPKVLIIQACRGSESTYAVTVGRVGKITKDYDDVDLHRTYTLPVEADILIVHSTFAGKTSHRDELNGTWFIQTLCNKINELAPTEDLESIITEVKKEVAIEKSLEEYNRRTFDFDTNKQIPVIVSTLIRKLYLKKNGDPPEEIKNLGNVVPDGFSNPVSTSRLQNCLCVFDKFEYLKNCMRYFLEDNEDDITGKSFLDVAETLSEGYEFHAVKEQLSKAMSNHLMTMAKDFDYYKYLYFYKDGS